MARLMVRRFHNVKYSLDGFKPSHRERLTLQPKDADNSIQPCCPQPAQTSINLQPVKIYKEEIWKNVFRYYYAECLASA
jgi:hypothetical protein